MYFIIKKALIIVFLSFTQCIFAQDNYEVVINYQFDDAKDFAPNGLASVKKDGKWGYIDQTGKMVIDYKFDDASNFASNGLAAVKKGDVWGYIDQTGNLIIDYQFIDALDFTPNGLANVRNVLKNGYQDGYIDLAGKVVIDYQFDTGGSFAPNGLACVSKMKKYGCIDQLGKMVIDYQFGYPFSFSPNGLAAVVKGNIYSDKFGYINQYGELVIDFLYDWAKNFAPNGLACAQKNGKWGYIDQVGKVVIDFQFDDCGIFTLNNMASVKKDGKWGYIDRTGKMVIDFQFDDANYFSTNGFAAVKKGSNWGLIDQTGIVVTGFQFDAINHFSVNGFANVKKGDKWGYINLISPATYISNYIRKEILIWQEKGKYEPIDAYKIRVNEVSRKKKLEELSSIAVKKIAPKYCNWNSIATEYDADNQTFKIIVNGLLPFYVKVSLAEAETFDASISGIQFQNLQYALGDDGKFFLQEATINNPQSGKTYNYSSTDKAVFAYTQLNMNFEPLNINLQTAGNNQPVNNEIKIVNVGLPEVDVNIPINPQTNYKTFVVIIANENYSREVKVQFAVNDGKVFKDYCDKTLGIPLKNIHYSKDATFGTMKSEIKWISDVAQAYSGQAKLIFYYAGHGMPNEQNKSAYLLPVDGFSSDYETAIKLDDLYNRLSQNPTQSVTVILDACFSGSVRDNGMLASARGVKIRPKVDALNGKMIVISAATGEETAYPYKEKQHGLFTYFLLKKLQETKGNVDYQTLSNYIIENVKQQSIVVNQKLQTPQVSTSTEIQNTWQMMRIK